MANIGKCHHTSLSGTGLPQPVRLPRNPAHWQAVTTAATAIDAVARRVISDLCQDHVMIFIHQSINLAAS